ncbi:MAG: hypothetical protein RL026_1965 [Pseudomonadota bacterium]|jgi:cyclopropane-fatty-acyl-phospholipid synthase
MSTAGSKPTIIPQDDPSASQADAIGSALVRLARRQLLQQLQQLRHGQLHLREGASLHSFGRPDGRCGLSATITVDHPRFWADAAFGGTTGAGESYIHGHWHCDDLTALIRIMVVNRHVMEGMEGSLTWLRESARRALHWAHRNSKAGSARNIAAHYDLGNELYELMLDSTMAYSCGIFDSEASTLEDASVAKFDATCRKLGLCAGDHLVEIGTGWGGLAIHAATHYGCRVTTTTISRQQHDYARDKIARLGLADRITLLFQDYRDLSGQYDKLVSIEMIEAVGAHYLDTYFAKCASLLKPEGAMLLQAITIQDQHYAAAVRSVDFIKQFVFPGSFIPSVTAIADSVTRATDLKIFNLEDIGPHYARTLREWRLRFMARLDEVRAMGYPDSFIRLWEFYLCYCEGGYEERQLGDVQVLLTKPACRLPPVIARA